MLFIFYKLRLILCLLTLNNLQYANQIIKFIYTKLIRCFYKRNIHEIRMQSLRNMINRLMRTVLIIPVITHTNCVSHVSFSGDRPGRSPGHECHPAGVFARPRLTEIHNKPTRQLVSFGQVSDRIPVLFPAGIAYEQICNISLH